MNYRNISPDEAFKVLKSELNSFLIDVRTEAEWAVTGVPDLNQIGKEVYTISWKFYPETGVGMVLNNDFASQVSENIPDKNAKLFFLCKSGGRSADAAVRMSGDYKNCYNITGGFEGASNDRQVINGWKTEGLPWRQI